MKTVLITGASRGIGAATAKRFAEGGYNVVINYNKSEAEAKSLAELINACAIKADIGNPAEVEEMMRIIEKDFGGADVIINNAGVSKFGLFTDMTEDEWQEIININLSGAYRVTRCGVKPMIAKKCGCIINISSMWGQVGSSCESAYSASKAGLIGLTKALAKELGPSNIRVNCIAPGVIDTDMNSSLTAETLAELAEDTPLMRLGKPEDIAELAFFLASDGAGFITGQIIGSNGGFVI